MSFHKILVAIDSSSHSLHASQKGLELAMQTNAEVALVFVIDSSRLVENVDAGIFYEEAIKALKKEAEETLDLVENIYDGEKLIKFMPIGHVEKEVLKTSESWGADVIVMGTHGHSDLMHLLTGSVTEYVIRHSKVPVMLVPKRHVT